ncbi:MAG: hypothetical protein HBSAPP04_14360 [Ignavibacteriaceae bacterium]|nr:MAG: hypothetical protein HBSAPP04_14360 [Ignavibacteriaceae bacterium]
MNRRRFLQAGGIGLLTIAGGSLFTDFHGAERVYPEAKAEDTLIIPHEFLNFLSYAVLAPSGHNTQPWLIRPAGENSFIVSLNRKCLLPAVDPMNRESILSIGAFMENLILTAGNSGYSTETEIIGSSTDILKLTLRKSKSNPYNMNSITGRRTVRNGYRQSDISPLDFSFVSGNDSINFHYFSRESHLGKFLADGTVEANRIQAFRDAAQQELANWIRWSKEEAELKMDGLTPESMEIDGFAGCFVRNFYERNSALEPTFRKKNSRKDHRTGPQLWRLDRDNCP